MPGSRVGVILDLVYSEVVSTPLVDGGSDPGPARSRAAIEPAAATLTAPRTDVVVTEGLTVAYGDRLALDHVDLRIESGTTVAVIGPNGSGKSTLLSAIAGLATPTSGTVTVSVDQVAIVLQSTEVDRTLPITVLETVRMARYPHRGMFGRLGADDRAAVENAMEKMSVTDLAHRQFHALSGGQRQRVLVAQALAQEADVLLLDEPVTGLDIVSQNLILEVIDAERAAGRAVVLTTHSLDEAARCDRVVLLDGRIIAAGAPEEVIVDGHLNTAFGTEITRLPTGQLLLDHPHHGC